MAAIDVADPTEDQRQTDLGDLISDHRPGDADDRRLEAAGYCRERNRENPARCAGKKITERGVGEQQPVDARIHALWRRSAGRRQAQRMQMPGRTSSLYQCLSISSMQNSSAASTSPWQISADPRSGARNLWRL